MKELLGATASLNAALGVAALGAAHALGSRALTLLGVHLLLVVALRAARAAKIARLCRDGADPWQVAYLIAFVEFPLMWEFGTSFGFFSTFAVPTISAVLSASKGFELCPQARYDDTAILIHEIGEHGPRSARGAAALKRTREIHAKYTIRRDDLAYTLWVFCFEPVRWVDAFGWRLVTLAEKRALWGFWREVGVGLGIADLPDEGKEFEAWGTAFEARGWRRAAANRRLSDYVINLAATWGPGPAALKRRLLLWSICALCPTPRLIDALGLQDDHKTTPRWFRVALKAVMYARGWAVGALLPPRPTWWPGTLLRAERRAPAAGGEPSFGCPAGCLTYKELGGYTISELGPPHAAAHAYPAGQ